VCAKDACMYAYTLHIPVYTYLLACKIVHVHLIHTQHNPQENTKIHKQNHPKRTTFHHTTPTKAFMNKTTLSSINRGAERKLCRAQTPPHYLKPRSLKDIKID